jgi:hypothetical protein
MLYTNNLAGSAYPWQVVLTLYTPDYTGISPVLQNTICNAYTLPKLVMPIRFPGLRVGFPNFLKQPITESCEYSTLVLFLISLTC